MWQQGTRHTLAWSNRLAMDPPRTISQPMRTTSHTSPHSLRSSPDQVMSPSKDPSRTIKPQAPLTVARPRTTRRPQQSQASARPRQQARLRRKPSAPPAIPPNRRTAEPPKPPCRSVHSGLGCCWTACGPTPRTRPVAPATCWHIHRPRWLPGCAVTGNSPPRSPSRSRYCSTPLWASQSDCCGSAASSIRPRHSPCRTSPMVLNGTDPGRSTRSPARHATPSSSRSTSSTSCTARTNGQLRTQDQPEPLVTTTPGSHRKNDASASRSNIACARRYAGQAASRGLRQRHAWRCGA